MPWHRPRQKLFLAAGIDLGGTFAAAAFVDHLTSRPEFYADPGWLFIAGGLFLLFGWLLGSYTVLKWTSFPLGLLVQRVVFTSLALLAALILLVWLLQIPETNALSHRFLLITFILAQGCWSLASRLLMRHISRLEPEPNWQLLAEPVDHRNVEVEWSRNPFVVPPQPLESQPLNLGLQQGLVLGTNLRLTPQERALVRELSQRGIPLTTLESLAERQLERLPPSLLPDEWLTLSDLPWNSPLSIDRQLKRFADLGLSLMLLLITFPLLTIAALSIWFEDQGPILYCQIRTGWMGAPFCLYKLRTMRSPSETDSKSVSWTVPGDRRITFVGRVLRRFRIDELPQLFNVVRGEMSLIGPRPERPELDSMLLAQIPHYQKRYWMLPGLSGWAQVCAPYASTLEDSEHKLSYDLYYLRHFSTALDFLILAKTIKTILRAMGR